MDEVKDSNNSQVCSVGMDSLCPIGVGDSVQADGIGGLVGGEDPSLGEAGGSECVGVRVPAVVNVDETMDSVFKDLMPFESWERIPGESAQAYAAFCIFRDFTGGRNIRRAMEGSNISKRSYNVWRNWSTKFQWSKRAADYDLYLDRLKRLERERTIEVREEAYRKATGKMLDLVIKRLDLMEPAELAQGNVVDWMRGSIDLERELLGLENREEERKGKQLEIRFTEDFDGV